MSYSSKKAYNNCPYRYKLRYVDRIVKIEDEEAANDRRWGSAVHCALEGLYKGKSEGECFELFKESYPKDLKASDPSKTIKSGELCIKQYISFWSEQDKLWEVLDVEVREEMVIAGESENLVIDLVARHKQSGDIYFWDHKTSKKRPTYSYWKQFGLSSQITRYTKHIQDKHGNCAGAIINNIVPGFRKRAYKGEPAGYHYTFERQTFQRSKQQVDFWLRSEEDWNALIDFSKASGAYPKALDYSCGYCDYYALCMASGDEQIREIMYKQREDK